MGELAYEAWWRGMVEARILGDVAPPRWEQLSDRLRDVWCGVAVEVAAAVRRAVLVDVCCA